MAGMAGGIFWAVYENELRHYPSSPECVEMEVAASPLPV